jgi:hypothetical protein
MPDQLLNNYWAQSMRRITGQNEWMTGEELLERNLTAALRLALK